MSKSASAGPRPPWALGQGLSGPAPKGTLFVQLELGPKDSVRILREIPKERLGFRLQSRPGSYWIELEDAAGRRARASFPVSGKLEVEGLERARIGDQLYLARAPVLVRLPFPQRPATLRVWHRDRGLLATFLLD
ncbi:MAG: hypothetical protein JKY65_06885 [Planctomycetes bacterium]|nr:hypothetical protein [Planctomycetota bacterium]